MEKKTLTQAQINLIWRKLKSRDHRRFFAIARYTGGKIKSICNLRVSDVYNINGLPLSFINLSGHDSKVHQSIVCNQLDELLRAYRPEIFNLESWLFPSRIKEGLPIGTAAVDKFIRTAAYNAYLDHLNVSASSLRKAFIKHLYESGVGSQTIKEILGIKKESQLKMYSELPKGSSLEVLNNLF